MSKNPAPLLTRRSVDLPAPRCAPTPALAGPHAPAIDPHALLTWATFDAVPTVLVEQTDRGLVLTWANRACGALLGCAEAELVGQPLSRLRRSPLVPRDAGLPDEDLPLLDPLRVTERDSEVQRSDGRSLPVRATSTPVSGLPTRWVVRLADARQDSKTERELRASQERFQLLSDQAPVGIFSSERGLRLAYVNDRFCRLLGASAERLLGTDWLSSLHPDDVEQAMSALHAVLEGSPVDLPLRVERADGEQRTVHARIVPVRNGRDAGFLGTLEDITERLAWEQLLAHQARHDALTGLANRRAVLEHTSAELAAGRPLALMLLDLDDFKLVNDTHGHDIGDLLLSAVGERLAGSVRDGDLVARFGGDEFAVVCRDVADEASAGRLAQRLHDAVTGPLSLPAGSWTVAGSLGVALSREGSTPEDLLRDADGAMYQAKALGKSTWALFDEQARDEAVRRQALVEDLRVALDAGALEVAYQPLMCLRGTSAVLAGVEALARWQHPERGAIPPEEFVELAEQHGLVAQLGETVLRRACAQLVAWDTQLGAAAPATVAVNVSVLQLRSSGFVALVAEVLASTGLPGKRLFLELTESAVLQDSTAAARTLGALRALGVRIALDDFGTGYSSLAMLRGLPVDQLKVDRSFLADLARSGSDVVVSAVVALAAALGLEAVAEGVETLEQQAELRRLNCPLAQGYLFSRPLAPEALVAWVRGMT